MLPSVCPDFANSIRSSARGLKAHNRRNPSHLSQVSPEKIISSETSRTKNKFSGQRAGSSSMNTTRATARPRIIFHSPGRGAEFFSAPGHGPRPFPLARTRHRGGGRHVATLARCRVRDARRDFRLVCGPCDATGAKPGGRERRREACGRPSGSGCRSRARPTIGDRSVAAAVRAPLRIRTPRPGCSREAANRPRRAAGAVGDRVCQRHSGTPGGTPTRPADREIIYEAKLFAKENNSQAVRQQVGSESERTIDVSADCAGLTRPARREPSLKLQR